MPNALTLQLFQDLGGIRRTDLQLSRQSPIQSTIGGLFISLLRMHLNIDLCMIEETVRLVATCDIRAMCQSRYMN